MSAAISQHLVSKHPFPPLPCQPTLQARRIYPIRRNRYGANGNKKHRPLEIHFGIPPSYTGLPKLKIKAIRHGTDGMVSVLVCPGCHNKILQTKWAKKHKPILSPFWGLKVQDQGVGRFGFSRGLSLWLADGHLLPVSSHCLPSRCADFFLL